MEIEKVFSSLKGLCPLGYEVKQYTKVSRIFYGSIEVVVLPVSANKNDRFKEEVLESYGRIYNISSIVCFNCLAV